EFGEIGTAGDARTQGLDLGPGRSLAVLAGPDQDVARLELGHRDGRVAGPGPALDQLDQLEARGRAHRPEDLARLHAGDDPRERGRDLVDAAPAQVAAFQRVGAVGVAHRRGLEFDCARLELRLELLGARLRGCDLVGGRAFRDADQDVRQVVLVAAGLVRHGRIDFAFGDADL